MTATRRQFLKLVSAACAAIGIAPKTLATPKRYYTKATHEEMVGMRYVFESPHSSLDEYEILRECVSGDEWGGHVIMNFYRNKFWVKTVGKPGKEFLICLSNLKTEPDHFNLSVPETLGYDWRFYKVQS